MVEPLPRWVKLLFAGVALSLLVLAGAWLLREPEPEPAFWVVDPAASLTAQTTDVPILVTERACASGRSPEGRIDVSVAYREDVVEIDVGVRPLRGGQDCQGIDPTPYLVRLSEPLGDRNIIGETKP